MSSSCKPTSGSFGSDIHRLLQAAEDGQRADILTYSSGHLGPRSLRRGAAHREPLWRVSHSPRTPPQTQAKAHPKALTYIKKRGVKKPPSEVSTVTASAESQVEMSRQDQAAGRSSCAGIKESPPKTTHPPSHPSHLRPRAFPQKKSNSPSDPEEKQRFCSDQKGEEGQLKVAQRSCNTVGAEQILWAEGNTAEIHERKLEEELKKLPVQSRPSRDRLAVFSDVFDDVCEDSPVFGRILREIKTEYDLYVDHMMASQSSLHSEALNASIEGDGTEENKRVRNELLTVPAIKSLEDRRSETRDSADTVGVPSKRLEVLNMWREVEQLEEEIKETLVSSVTTTASDRHMKELKAEILRLMASNNRLNTTNKDLENNINTVLNREKASKAMKRMLWDEIHCDPQTD